MILNENTVIKGNLVFLVPYEEYHVLRYHEWMKSEELQLLTASEPLSLDEEYQMQKSWRSDPDIKEKYIESGDEVQAMVGDTNIFLLKTDNGESVAEVEIMIAESSARGKGLGKEALLFMLRYGVEDLHIKEYEAKIGVDNSKSISLFTKIGFQKISENKVFNEITFQRLVTDSWKDWLLSETKSYSKENRPIMNCNTSSSEDSIVFRRIMFKKKRKGNYSVGLKLSSKNKEELNTWSRANIHTFIDEDCGIKAEYIKNRFNVLDYFQKFFLEQFLGDVVNATSNYC